MSANAASAQGRCRLCGAAGEGQPFAAWVRPTFLDHDKLYPGEIICSSCSFWFEERSAALQARLQRDKPQPMRAYSHFIKGGVWTPCSKAHKAQMRALLTEPPFPELAVIAVSGQKHLAFRARRNAPGQPSGWAQFEETAVWVLPDQLISLWQHMAPLYAVFSKAEIASGRYSRKRLALLGADVWSQHELPLARRRGSALFDMALFLLTHSESQDEMADDQGE